MPKSSNPPPTRSQLLLYAAMLMAIGGWVSYMGFTHAPRFNAPTWVAYLLGLIFIGASARLLEMASGRAGTGNWYATIFFGAFAAVAWWVAFEGKGCSGLGPFIGGSVSCRVFAIPAAISTGLAIHCARLLVRNS